MDSGSRTPQRGRGHGHTHRRGGAWARLKHAVTPHSHDAAEVVDGALEASRKGMRALWISFAALLVTAIGQAFLVAFTGSVALLGDTLHNFADAMTAVPLAIAFLLARHAATRRFTYGLGRSEDLAGLVILAVIAASAAMAGWEAIRRLIDPQQVDHLGWLVAAGLLGFAGNELVARYRIRVGREIGSAALVADGLHARTDGFTSLAVLGSAGGAALGWRWADPVIGLLITAAIVAVLWGSAKEVLGRVLDAVDPELVGRAELALTSAPGVRRVDGLRMRWIGHTLHAEAELDVAPELSLADAHRIAHDAEHRLWHALPRLGGAVIHTHPAGPQATADHDLVAHHRR
ncbi:cation diffusion facilitator family transporter [Saccharopolyspora pogona]|uniref:cation diffusion facilitator family transporter n=1 Tax=Saccharopolyspora pogona TaxID=333966 RepID=UPI0016880D41|nr:cation diffusion facilitator family transporter [Saccharopolyspora pogona]